jgi:hypothetical protein
VETHFELYVKQENRWLLEANFASHQRDEAIEETKQLERQGHVQAVKVVREQRNASTGLTRETMVYLGGRDKGQGKEAAQGRRRPVRGRWRWRRRWR